MAGFTEAYFISPQGEIIRTPMKHITSVLTEPEKFGLNKEVIEFIYKRFGERMGQEGKAREEILKLLFNQGWTRLRRYGDNFWTVNVNKLTPKVKGYLSKWAQAMLKGKFGFQDYGSMQVRIDQKGKPLSSSDLETMANNKNFMTEGKKVNLQFKELKDLQDRPLIPEAKRIMRMIKYLNEGKIVRTKKPRPGLFYYTTDDGSEYAVEYEPNPEYSKSKPWKLSELGVGGMRDPLCRCKTKKEAVETIKSIEENK